MSIYLERCDICRDYKPVLLFREGKSTLAICLRCAYTIGKAEIKRDKVVTMESEDSVAKISRVIDELMKD